jgi:predicted XRE-type DNA-binding protein
MANTDIATIRTLRGDVALQIARHARRLGLNQVAAAKRLGVPQPTLSKIVNGHVSDISLELLIRLAVRAGLPLSLQTGHAPQEAGAFVSITHTRSSRASRSRLSDEARDSLIRSENLLSPSQRLEAFLEHSQHLAALQQAGRAAEAQRVHNARRTK